MSLIFFFKPIYGDAADEIIIQRRIDRREERSVEIPVLDDRANIPLESEVRIPVLDESFEILQNLRRSIVEAERRALEISLKEKEVALRNAEIEEARKQEVLRQIKAELKFQAEDRFLQELVALEEMASL